MQGSRLVAYSQPRREFAMNSLPGHRLALAIGAALFLLGSASGIAGPLQGKSIILSGLGPGRVLLDEPNAYASINPITFNRPDGNVSLLMTGFFLNIGGRLIVISTFTGLTSPSDIDWATRGAQLWIRQVQAANGPHPAAQPSHNTVR